MLKRLFSRAPPPPRLQVLFVCMGNVCRSPLAEAVLRAKLVRQGLDRLVAVDSAGTHGIHRGHPPDPRALALGARRGYPMADLRSRPVVAEDYARFDLLLAMDRQNLERLRDRCPPAARDRLHLLLPFAAGLLGEAPAVDEVPDPYYGPPAGFERVLDLLEPACDSLLEHLRQRLA